MKKIFLCFGLLACASAVQSRGEVLTGINATSTNNEICDVREQNFQSAEKSEELSVLDRLAAHKNSIMWIGTTVGFAVLAIYVIRLLERQRGDVARLIDRAAALHSRLLAQNPSLDIETADLVDRIAAGIHS